MMQSTLVTYPKTRIKVAPDLHPHSLLDVLHRRI